MPEAVGLLPNACSTWHLRLPVRIDVACGPGYGFVDHLRALRRPGRIVRGTPPATTTGYALRFAICFANHSFRWSGMEG